MTLSWICNDEKSVIDITKQIISNTENDDKKSINTAKYKGFYVFDSGNHCYSHIEDLYIDHSDLMHRLIEQNDIETTGRDDEGRYRLLIGTGFIEIIQYGAVQKINVVTLRRFIIHANRNDKRNNIICQDWDLEMVKEVAEGASLRVSPIRER